ncbi:asparagine synthase (glutamine-hydrolyzing) [Psychrosphaera sp. B3R10]|uniref:asparagine synthase (glutamine-hydrolyzing) n=1 Tax=unclassified Psychrosphaera TaxID=2641570 RepID=UPI001C09A8FA|nr:MULTISPECIES: asparagine synthase (glutamine-hydrolyzing) [unclassified Psychrosphaera]MBU2883715.1 asparagine synthase (glutamine-hydrolyzing) [Psychrosphaera sp. I2R16]MBU2987983.1 asparagine synthase (glutamine-hydrolyzing) [Psychrosphaera sp. B3R10]
MCGLVAGFVNSKTNLYPQSQFIEMTETLHHRGPDETGYYFNDDNTVALGHKRLSIIDLANGQQPAASDCGNVQIVFNGEIYNYKELKQTLVKLGHTFHSDSDTEVLLHCWLQWQHDCLKHLNGMFSFVVWDQAANLFFAARDRLGIKPLFWTKPDDNSIYFASELKSLILNDNNKTLNTSAIHDYFSLGYVPEPKCIYDNYNKLEAGHYISAHLDDITNAEPVQYWDCLDSINKHLSETPDSDIDNGLKTLTDSINMRTVADVPVGAFLSGGLDSSVIVSTMSKTSKVCTYSMGFDTKEYDESADAQTTANLFNTDHTDIIVSANAFEYLDDIIDMFDEPFADNSTIPTYLISKQAAKRVKVVLSGDGADELFLGYRNYRMLKLETQLRRIFPKPIHNVIFGSLAKFYPTLAWAPQFLRAQSTFKSLTGDIIDNFHEAMSLNSDCQTQLIFNSEFNTKNNGYSSKQIFQNLAAKVKINDPIKKAQYIDFKTYLPSNILTKVDRTSMANSIEVRVPFLDHRLVQNWIGHASNENIKGSKSKLLLRKIAKNLLPHKILHKSKKSFTSPMDEWFRMMPPEKVRDIVDIDTLSKAGMFNTDHIENLITLHLKGKNNLGMSLWSIAVFARFLKKANAKN